MRGFDTHAPISLEVSIEAGSTRIVAGDGGGCGEEVRPANERRRDDVEAAEQTHVTIVAGTRVVKAPNKRGLWLSVRCVTVHVLGDPGRGLELRVSGTFGAYAN